jgi:HEAT repeat protein
MNDVIDILINDLNTGSFQITQQALSQSALLIERHALNRYDDLIYEQLLPQQLLEYKLSDRDFNQLLETLVEMLDHQVEHASSAAWALGKSYSDRVVPKLVEALRKYWQSHDEITYQILIALDNYGLEQAKGFLEMIAARGKSKSRELVLNGNWSFSYAN